MLEGGLSKYLSHLDKEQQALVNLNVRSLLLIKGGAGTGKTAVAVHRLLASSRQATLTDTSPQDVLYLCYNKLLTRVAHQLIETICVGVFPEHVYVNTFHTWCYEYLQATGGCPRLDEDGCEQAVFRAMGKLNAEQKLALVGYNGKFVTDEIVQVIKQNGIMTPDVYLEFERRGRSSKGLKKEGRKAVWAIYTIAEDYQQQRNICRYSDLPILALERMSASAAPPQYRAIVIDEGQDCSPVLIRLARQLLITSRGQLTVLADPAQAIYECGFQWTQDEIKPKGGNVRYLRKNYRTTRQIYDLAGDLLDNSVDSREDRDQMQPPDRLGPKPVFTVVLDEPELFRVLVAKIKQELVSRSPSQIAVLAANWDTLKRIEDQLRSCSIAVGIGARGAINLNEPTVKLLSMHSVKGLDFPIVFVVGPKLKDLGGAARAELPETRRVLYVALTRASEQLTILALDQAHHPLLEDLVPECYEAEGVLAQGFINRRGISMSRDGIVVQRI